MAQPKPTMRGTVTMSTDVSIGETQNRAAPEPDIYSRTSWQRFVAAPVKKSFLINEQSVYLSEGA